MCETHNLLSVGGIFPFEVNHTPITFAAELLMV